jgi:nucleoid DNA-binding protein
MAKSGVGKPISKSEVLASLAETTGLTKKQIATVLEALSGLINKNVGKKGPGVFAVPGLMKITVIHKEATKARKGINRFTGEEVMFKAKPARKVVKIRALKALKDMVK